jgi:4-amino-4-deoxy-L-arabinose transferase-like glycosyltransferase
VVRAPRQALADPALRWPLAWAGFVLIFFSLAATKLPHYALYGATPLLLLMAREVGQRGASRGVAMAVVAAAMVLVLLGTATVPLAQGWATSAAAGAHWQQRLQVAWSVAGPSSGLAPLLLLGQAVAAAAAWHHGPLRLAAGLAAASAAAGWLLAVVVPFWAQVLQGPVRALALEARERGLPLVQWQVHQPSVGFYRGLPAPRREPRPGEAALLRSDRLDAAQASSGHRLHVLRQEPGFVLVWVPQP